MKIFTGSQIKELDRYTIEHEPIESIELMERAAESMSQFIAQEVGQDSVLVFVIGKGNNGGDGLAMARILANAGFDCRVYMPFTKDELTPDCLFNFERLPDNIPLIDDILCFSQDPDVVIVDAVLGSGTKGEVSGKAKQVIDTINRLGCYVISVDLPSGMKTEFGNDPMEIVHADMTLSIELPKLAMLLPEAGGCCGDIRIVPIGLSNEYIESTSTKYHYVSNDMIQDFILPRSKFSHKGVYGHALLVCGSKGMCGAAVLSTSAALRSGCGLVTVHTTATCAVPVYANSPSAMVSTDCDECFSELPLNLDRFNSVGIGCGLGQSEKTQHALASLLSSYNGRMVLDADALNIIASDPEIRKCIVPDSILTPHPGEFRRLVGEWSGEQDKILKLRTLAAESQSIVVLKGANTLICDPSGSIYINSTGTPGMAKGGSGDVLTGLITGLLARGYAPLQAAILGVYMHGVAGEKAADYFGIEAMNSGDIIDFLGDAFNELKN